MNVHVKRKIFGNKQNKILVVIYLINYLHEWYPMKVLRVDRWFATQHQLGHPKNTMVSRDHSLKGIKMTRRSDIYDNSTCTLYALFSNLNRAHGSYFIFSIIIAIWTNLARKVPCKQYTLHAYFSLSL